MGFLRYCRPCLRLYYRYPKVAVATIAFIAIITFIYPTSITQPFETVKHMFSSPKTKDAYQSNDIFIASHEYKFELAQTSTPSLFGSAHCLLLDFDYKNEAILKYQKDFGELTCSGDRVTILGGGVLHVKGVGLQDVSYQAIQAARTHEDKGFTLGDRMSVVTAQVQLTPEHSGSIAHFLGKCIHPLGASTRPGVQLVLWDSCGEERIAFQLEEDGTLRHKTSQFCVGPKLEIAESNKPLVLTDRCDDSTKFRGLENGFLQHLSSELCIHYQSLEITPPNDVPLVFYEDCEKNWKMRFGWAKDFSKSRKKETDITTEISDEFIQVNVQFASGLPSHDATEYHLQVFPKFNLKQPKEMDLKPNMLVLMLHSVSYSHFMRKLPKTYAFLQKLSGTVFFKGFSVFDDSSKSQLLATLAGVEPDKVDSFNSFDELSWLHTLHKEQGYVTLMTEDKPCSVSYSDALCGFKDTPTDHFGLPFWAAVHQTYSPGQNTFCLGKTAIHNISLGYLRDFMAIYTRLPKYAIVSLSELSSWNFNTLSYQDEDLARFFAWMKIKGHLDHTVITIFSNHGSKNDVLRKTLQGKLEERNPYLSITIPPKAPKALLDALPTLRKNSKGLVTPFDLYATLRRMDRTIPLRHGGQGENLLEPFKDEEKRSCEDLNIPKQWCPCLAVYEHNENNKNLQNASKQVVDFANKIISSSKEMSDQCLKLEFSSLKKATRLSPSDEVLKFKFSKQAGKCSMCKPVYGTKPKDMFYILYIEVKEGITLRAIVNIKKGQAFIHPKITGTGSKENACYRTRTDATDVWKLCSCK